MKFLLRLLKYIFLPIGWILLIILIFNGILYLWCPIYNFEEPAPFSGANWFNPYKTLEPNWYKANFQVQSNAWAGTTDGKDGTLEVYNKYKELGYDIISISDYQKINRFKGIDTNVLPVYEHGYNAFKRHHVMIGAEKVEWRDYLLWQTHSNMQNMINTLRPQTPFLLLAHPRLRNSITPENARILSNYDALEVLNHYRNSSNVWDAALSAGKRAWLIGDDDSHKISDPNQTGVIWTMINAPDKSNKEILSALKSGHMYGVVGRNAENKNFLSSVSINGDTLTIACTDTADVIRFIGQDGAEKQETENNKLANYLLKSDDTYIRTEILNGKTRMYLNPVYRYDSSPDFKNTFQINWTLTWLQRIAGIGLIVAFLFWQVKRKKKN